MTQRISSMGLPNRQHEQPASAGFTLVELLAALVLASLLSAALLQLVKTVHRKSQQVTELAAHDEQWTTRIFEWIQQDLRNSRRMAIAKNEIRLSGFGGTNAQTGDPDQTPAEIVYRIIQSGNRYCLQREERKSQSLTNTNIVRRLIATDVDEISFWFADAPDMNWLPDIQIQSDWMPIPAAIVVQISIADSTATNPDVRSTNAGRDSQSAGNSAIRRQTLMIRPGAN